MKYRTFKPIASATIDLTPITTKNSEQDTAIASKAAQTDLTALTTRVATTETSKADKTALAALDTTINDRVTDEAETRHNADTALGTRIGTAEQSIADLAGTVEDDLALKEDKTVVAALDAAYKAADTALDTKKLDKSAVAIETIDYWRGYFQDQAGDNFHTFTTLRSQGSNITTSDNKTFTLTRGIYEVDFFAAKHFANNAWRATALFVNGGEVTSCYSGHDSSNWESGGSFTHIVDATSANKTVQIKRTASSNNGNLTGYLTIRRIPATNIVTVPDNTKILNVRNISGSIAAKGFDTVTLPYQIALTPGTVLSSVSLNGTATTDFDPYTGVVRITPNGADVVVSHAIAQNSTFSGLQRADYSTTELAITSSFQTYTLNKPLLEGDLLEVQHQFNGNAAERQSVWVRVQAGSTQRNFPWADATNNTAFWTFPSPLNNTFQTRQATAGSSPRILSVKVWRDAANGYVVPIGTQARNGCTITANDGNVTVNGLASDILFSGTSGRIKVAVPANQEILSATCTSPLVSVGVADPATGALEVAIAGSASGSFNILVIYQAARVARWYQVASAGVAVNIGNNLKVQMASGGNRSFQIGSQSGSLNVNWATYCGWSGVNPVVQGTKAIGTAFEYFVPAWGFGSQGDTQYVLINEVANGRAWRIECVVGAAYNNNLYFIEG